MWFYASASLPINLLTASYSFFLLILTSVYLPLVGLEGYWTVCVTECDKVQHCTLSHSVTHTHTHTHIQIGRTTLGEGSACLNNTTPTTDIHAPGGIRTCNPSKPAASDPRFIPRDHRDRPCCSVYEKRLGISPIGVEYSTGGLSVPAPRMFVFVS